MGSFGVTFRRPACSSCNKMKTESLPIKAFLAALAAIALIPVGPGAASIAFTVTGLLALLLSDYGRGMVPLRPSADVLRHDFGGRGRSRLDQAA
jgi:hypothetical protein